VTSVKQAGRIAAFGIALGAGLLFGAGAAAATASAAPSASGHESSTSSAHSTLTHRNHTKSTSTPSASTPTADSDTAETPASGDQSAVGTLKHTGTRSNANTAKPRIKQSGSATTDTVGTSLTTTRHLSVARPAAAVDRRSPTPVVTKVAALQAVPSLTTPVDIQHAIQATLDAIRRDLTALAQNIVLAFQHQIQGIQRNFAILGADIARIFSPPPPPIDPPSPTDVEYGNYTANKPYWYYQGKLSTCVLMSVAGIIGQLSPDHTMPGQEEIIDQASSTPSDVVKGETIYEPQGENPASGYHWAVYYVDAVKLLELNGIEADYTQYTKGQGQLALDQMTAALGAGQGVIVGVNNNILYNGYANVLDLPRNLYPVGNGIVQSNHAVIVLSVDLTKNVVYLNDSALKNGQGFAVPLDEFMKAWQTGGYTTVTAQLAQASAATQPTALAA
jgi:hypothetical protein